MLRPSDSPEANDKIMNDIKAWRFTPYSKDGRAVAVCSTLVLAYVIE
jgi:hypothetical protein